MKFKKDKKYYSSCYCNKNRIVLQTDSRINFIVIDISIPPKIDDINIDDHTLGIDIINSLMNSREINDKEDDYSNFSTLDALKSNFHNWQNLITQELGGKNQRAIFKNMKCCSIEVRNEEIIFSPLKQVKLNAWEGLDTPDIILPINSSYEEIGKGLRLALNKCL